MDDGFFKNGDSGVVNLCACVSSKAHYIMPKAKLEEDVAIKKNKKKAIEVL